MAAMSTMKERTRYRISGSLFLIALAVIFVPFLFDGAGVKRSVVPPVPDAPDLPPVAVYDEVVPETDVVERVADLAAEVDDEGFTTESGERFGEPVLRPVTEDTSIWAVQAAAFARLENAQELRSRLRDAGLEAFLSSTKLGVDVMHRVAVGPLLDQEDARSIALRIQREFDLEAQLVEMQP